MDSILITPKTDQEYSFVMEMLRRMNIKAKPIHEKGIECISGLPYTYKEILEDIRCSEEDILAGRTISNEALRKKITT